MQGNLFQLWEATVRSQPDSAALVTEGERLSYREVNERANQLARLLISHGAGPERLVALALPRSSRMVVSVLAVAKTGAAFLPIDVSYPADRVSYMLHDADPVLLCTTRAAATELPAEHSVPTLVLDTARQVSALEALSRSDLDHGERTATPSVHDLAYVIYTSGSTGRPKGVAVTHTGLAALASTKVEAMQVGPDSRVLQFASPSFDAIMTEMLAAFTAGAALVVPTGATLAGRTLRTALHRHQVTHAVLPPAAVATISPEDVPDLQTLIVAGEACPPALVRRWAGRLRLINAYGPTETTVCATMTGPLDPTDEVTIGRPIPGCTVHILNDRLQSTAAGQIGELYVSGPGLARGYLGRPALTAERFVASPFLPAGTRMYRTGDLAAWRPDGTIVFHGRGDEQVQLRGFRIELGDVESVLDRHPDVAQAVCTLRQDAAGTAQLVGYVVPVNGTVPTPAQLREHALRYLPDHMVPSVYATIETVALTPNGKVDRGALPDPATAGPRGGGRQPRTPAEKALCGVFGELFTDREISVESNFFELGGTSILAIDFILRAQEAGLDLSPREVIENPTIEALAAVVAGQS